jgi:hypothetical protein
MARGSANWKDRNGKLYLVAALIILYAAASLRIDSIHQIFHADEIANLHSPEQEVNPCHKSIYHQQRENGCEHRSHVSAITKCPACECKIATDEWVVEPQVGSLLFQFSFEQSTISDDVPIVPHPFRFGRAPPSRA